MANKICTSVFQEGKGANAMSSPKGPSTKYDQFIRGSMEKIDENGNICVDEIPTISFVRLVYRFIWDLFIILILHFRRLST